MNKPQPPQWKMAASLVCLALLTFVSSASAQLTVTTANQIGTANTYPFTPTWTPASGSLIAGLAPSATAGNFTLDLTTRNVNTLTSGGSLAIGTLPGDAGPDTIGNTTTSSNYVTCGNRTAAPAAGSLIVYTLPASANGYNLTNITVFSGWADNGRDAQAYTVLYSTVVNTNSFIYLATVTYNPSVAGSTPSANQSVINDASGGVIASNVAAVKFVMNFPTVENGWTGYGAITVQGTAASSVATLSVTTATQTGTTNTWPFTPTWTLETDSLIAGNTTGAGNVTTNGNFNLESQAGTRDVNSLTLNTTSLTIDNVGSPTTTSPNYVTCGGGSGSGSSIIYALTNSPNGSDVTNIVVYNGWANNGRDGQYYKVSYATILAPTTYIPITTVFYLPSVAANTPVANRVAISFSTGAPLAKNVANLKFDFASPTSAGSFNNGYQGYVQIIVEGTNSAPPTLPPSPFPTQDTLPTHAETVVGDQVVFTAAYSNGPPANLQWQQIVTGPAATNNINTGVVNVTNSGVVTSTLTLNNVQLTNSGSYRLQGLNATNGAAAPSYSAAAPLVVGTNTVVGNVIVSHAGQTGPSSFYPAWIVDTNNDLILGFPTDGSGNPGTATAGAGNYALEAPLNGDPTILADGIASDAKPNMVSCGWVNVGAGQSMTYTLDTNSASAPFGFNLTNITVYGGWSDDGRNEQKYQVQYSTVTAPNTFVVLLLADYNPTFTSGEPNATRTTLTPVTGSLVHNVYALRINFNLQSKNNWNGYSEIIVKGTPAAAIVPPVTQDITPLTAEDVVDSTLTLTAAFSGADSVQWQKNGTNIPGATSTTLTLNNLQLTNTGSYSLVASNAGGLNATRACAVIVDPAPAATNNIITAFAYQTSDAGAGFGPTWDTSALSSSLISGQNPPSGGFGSGNFNDPDGNFPNSAGGFPVLTDGNYGVFALDGSHPASATGGINAGRYVIYTLGANANGYDVTNIQIAGGWNDNGRDSQYYTVYYSTVANHTFFIPLVAVQKNLNSPSYGVNDETAIRTTLTPAAGVLASNVYAIYVDFTQPAGVPNNYSGYSEVSVFGSGSPSAPSTPLIGVTVANESLAASTPPSWTIETPNLIAGQSPSAVGTGNFQIEAGVTGTSALTDGTFGNADTNASYATCGNNAGRSVTYANVYGWNLTNIVVYSGWANYDRDGQFYNITYSTLAAPTTFIPLTSVFYDPPNLGGASANRVDIAPINGATYLATNVYAVRFDFTPQTGGLDNGYSGYAEIVLQGASLPPPLTVTSTRISAGNLILTGIGGTSGGSYTWLTTTNLLTPMASWTISTTGVFDGGGAFSNAVPIDAAKPASFFRLRTP